VEFQQTTCSTIVTMVLDSVTQRRPNASPVYIRSSLFRSCSTPQSGQQRQMARKRERIVVYKLQGSARCNDCVRRHWTGLTGRLAFLSSTGFSHESYATVAVVLTGVFCSVPYIHRDLRYTAKPISLSAAAQRDSRQRSVVYRAGRLSMGSLSTVYTGR